MKIGSKLQCNCGYKDGPFQQGDSCSRCPLFNCSKEDDFCLIEPEDYRDDWAEEWVKYFNELKE
jgi:hypothetical protein